MQTAVYPIQKKIIPDAVLGIAFLVAAEIMFFSGLISAYMINRSGVSNWPPVDQPRLPMVLTAFNTIVLLVSGILIFMAQRNLNSKMLRAGTWLGILFLVLQGNEWVRMLNYGLHTSSNIYGAFFYTIIGAHGLHVLAGIALLVYLNSVCKKENNSETIREKFSAFGLYWYFVVAIWPVLYGLLYFS